MFMGHNRVSGGTTRVTKVTTVGGQRSKTTGRAPPWIDVENKHEVERQWVTLLEADTVCYTKWVPQFWLQDRRLFLMGSCAPVSLFLNKGPWDQAWRRGPQDWWKGAGGIVKEILQGFLRQGPECSSYVSERSYMICCFNVIFWLAYSINVNLYLHVQFIRKEQFFFKEIKQMQRVDFCLIQRKET